jgi:hypothetical protein
LYVTPPLDGSHIDIATRPVPGAVRADALQPSARTGCVVTATGDLETGRLVTARCRSPEAGWTVVAERFLSPTALSAGGQGVAGMLALSALGVLAAAAFAHALRAGLSGRVTSVEVIAHGPQRLPAVSQPRPQAAPRTAAPSAPVYEQDVVPTGSSLLRLREACGETGEGPDLAACARSPILRALSMAVRSDEPRRLPNDVHTWAKAA